MGSLLRVDWLAPHRGRPKKRVRWLSVPVTPQMPLAAAPSMLGPGQPLPNPQMPPTAYLPMGYGYAGAGQGYAGYGYAPTMPGYGGIYPASYTGDGSGAPQPLPMEGAAPMSGGEAAVSGDYMAPGGECEYCYGEGCTHCLGLASFLSSGLSWLLPFSEGGCCAPRWYDITVDYMYLRRDNVSSRVDFTSDGILGDIVLSTDNLDFDWRSGLRFTGAMQALVGGSLEFTYFGLLNWSSNANVSDPHGDLYSVISDFGTDPLGGFDETDRSKYQSIAYSSSIDSFELHFRKRWVGPNCRLQGSWLAGVRYVYLLEDFKYYTVGGDQRLTDNTLQSRGSMDY